MVVRISDKTQNYSKVTKLLVKPLNNISSEFFGFTELEVKQLLKDYNLSKKMDEVKEWYDGYQFGNKEIYNPWSTLMYVKNITQDVSFKPISFWANTSGNDLVVKYIQNGDKKYARSLMH